VKGYIGKQLAAPVDTTPIGPTVGLTKKTEKTGKSKPVAPAPGSGEKTRGKEEGAQAYPQGWARTK